LARVLWRTRSRTRRMRPTKPSVVAKSTCESDELVAFAFSAGVATLTNRDNLFEHFQIRVL
jgi:hypothetical protein